MTASCRPLARLVVWALPALGIAAGFVLGPPATAGSGANGTKERKVHRVCRVTAYCDRGVTASGVRSGTGQCAAPVHIPLGASVYVPDLGRSFVVTDRTHRRFRNSTVDIFIPSRQQCRKFGAKYLHCDFTIPESPEDALKSLSARR